VQNDVSGSLDRHPSKMETIFVSDTGLMEYF
jgi:hypothetical protein